MTFYFLFDLFLHLISDPLALSSPRLARFRGPGQRSASSDPWKGEALHQLVRLAGKPNPGTMGFGVHVYRSDRLPPGLSQSPLSGMGHNHSFSV